ncbi:hypothetical protein EVAR_102733_1 [Eumeta japonica]|uniref:Uncharacterized protein n=1 Tax=Eumeta variegata TaxID=151549 RepID=A0A4C1TKC3_EUMVA|nr:hypothetical protein EVAR_102733_1 [Eumeta japonica]
MVPLGKAVVRCESESELAIVARKLTKEIRCPTPRNEGKDGNSSRFWLEVCHNPTGRAQECVSFAPPRSARSADRRGVPRAPRPPRITNTRRRVFISTPQRASRRVCLRPAARGNNLITGTATGLGRAGDAARTAATTHRRPSSTYGDSGRGCRRAGRVCDAQGSDGGGWPRTACA